MIDEISWYIMTDDDIQSIRKCMTNNVNPYELMPNKYTLWQIMTGANERGDIKLMMRNSKNVKIILLLFVQLILKMSIYS